MPQSNGEIYARLLVIQTSINKVNSELQLLMQDLLDAEYGDGVE